MFGDTQTDYTYTVVMVNEGNAVLTITGIDDSILTITASDNLSYLAGTASSTPTSLAYSSNSGEPKTNLSNQDVYTLDWPKSGVENKALATSTTWTLDFQVRATLPRGSYTNETSVGFKKTDPSDPTALPAQTTWPTAVITP